MSKPVSIHLGAIPVGTKSVASIKVTVTDSRVTVKTDYSAAELAVAKEMLRAGLLAVTELESIYDKTLKRKLR